MRKLILLCLFVIGLGAAVFGFLNFQGLAVKGDFETILLDFREDIPSSVVQQNLQAIAKQYNVTPQLDNKFSAKDNVYIIEGDGQRLQELKKSQFAQVTEFIEPNYIYRKIPQPGEAAWLGEFLRPQENDEVNLSLTGPNDQYYSKQWNLHKIGIEGAWSQTKGSGVTVAVIDTGITKVRDLYETKFVKGYDFVNDREKADDDNGHGTHVAGTIAQATNNKYGVAGIAYEASLMPLKVLSAYGGGTVADIAEAIKFASDKGADVINMSLGGGGESKLMKEAIEYAHRKGVVIIAAAGNESANGASYPARYPHVIGVSAIGPDGEKAPYSNFGAGVDISAPGGSEAGKILQETINEKGEGVFLGFQGTSMASPHVAGVAALIKASGIKEPDEILKVLKQSARVIQDDGLNYYGAGQLNAEAAVKLAVGGQISFQDFFRWLRDNGYLNPGFWIDGGAVALLPKILMVIGSYLLAWFLRVYFPFTWSWSLFSGLIAGSSGLFFLKGIYIFDLPQWPFRVFGSSIPELGNTLQGTDALNPLFASVLIPIVLMALLLGHPSWKWFAIGSTLGVAACLTVSAIYDPAVWGFGNVNLARLFLIANAILCYGLARLALQNEEKAA
ncbi:serine protease [Nostoc linckia z18]|uniref:Serine protease n=2 Tax=Nostoc linckia TaxID=92942 RepID=A0A9Q5Z554_NOSLI|nr:S8 family peptidase [Nostoc linckia]PHK30192.1 serine protease [Nostoc linckia z15]PHK46019.1 serine protease [Nostoc linckia z16]PHJ57592.1 serine protease [Nostoc linckia z3]PHJ59007.1 serine protease [Nostoc linckia z2]PHJ59804.1 serine protease [Nostoc linckia z1]